MTERARAEVFGATTIFRVRDIPASMRYFTEILGFEKAWDYGDFASVKRDKAEIFLSTDQGALGAWICLLVTNADALHDEVAAKGATIVMPLTDMEHGMREFWVRDPDGNVLRLGHVLHAKNFKVKRVPLDARIEERMAAVLKDVAAATGRSVGEVLEETLAHSFYNVGPHTDGTLDLIAKLKAKHGMDYDVHDNYRFTEE
jgi:catechol 2,3-dioxygenase-like lactoylglutathione lyase family enzyme